MSKIKNSGKPGLWAGLTLLLLMGLAACGDAQPTIIFTPAATSNLATNPAATTVTMATATAALSTGATPASSTALPVTSGSQEKRWNFDSDSPGSLPQGAASFSGQWAVRPEAGTPSTPNALCQTGQATFPALKLSEEVYTNFTFSTRFKPISGKEDQAGGLIFRIQDANNYYIVRANALEGNVNLYKYAGGNRSVIKEGTAPVAGNTWHELKVEARGNSIKWSLDGKPVGETTDTTYQAGKLGLWTKADSLTCFDDVLVNPG